MNRYTYDFDVNDPNLAAACAVRWMRGHQRILELGAAGGHVTRKLREQGSSVVAVEFDGAALPVLKQIADQVIQADLDVVTETELAQHGPFDGVIATDVLEHLRDPDRVVAMLARMLRPNGTLVVSLPNVAHGDVRLALLSGRFEPTPTGLLDATHLRFFTFTSARGMMERHGFDVVDVHRTRWPLGTTEQAAFCDERYENLRLRLTGEPEAETYQFVFLSALRGTAIVNALAEGRRQRERAERAEAEHAARDEQIRGLSAERDAARKDLAQGQHRVAELEGAIAREEALVQRLNDSWSLRTGKLITGVVRRLIPSFRA